MSWCEPSISLNRGLTVSGPVSSTWKASGLSPTTTSWPSRATAPPKRSATDASRTTSCCIHRSATPRAELCAQLGIQLRHRFVHEEQARAADEHPRHRDTLTLATRELPRPSHEQVIDRDEAGHLLDSTVDHGSFLFRQSQGETDVLCDREVRVQRAALKRHCDTTTMGIDLVHHHPVDHHLAGGGPLDTGDHPKERCLAASRRTDEHEELAVADEQVCPIDRMHLVAIATEHLAHPSQLDGRHRSPDRDGTKRRSAMTDSEAGSVDDCA